MAVLGMIPLLEKGIWKGVTLIGTKYFPEYGSSRPRNLSNLQRKSVFLAELISIKFVNYVRLQGTLLLYRNDQHKCPVHQIGYGHRNCTQLCHVYLLNYTRTNITEWPL